MQSSRTEEESGCGVVDRGLNLDSKGVGSNPCLAMKTHCRLTMVSSSSSSYAVKSYADLQRPFSRAFR